MYVCAWEWVRVSVCTRLLVNLFMNRVYWLSLAAIKRDVVFFPIHRSKLKQRDGNGMGRVIQTPCVLEVSFEIVRVSRASHPSLKYRAYVFKSIPTHIDLFWYKLMKLSKVCQQQQQQQQTFYNWISWITHRMINDLIGQINEKRAKSHGTFLILL